MNLILLSQNFQKKIGESIYKYPSLVPAMTWIDSIAPSKPVKLKAKINEGKVYLNWKSPRYDSAHDSAAYFVIYRFDEEETISTTFSNKILSIQKNNEFVDTTATLNKHYKYVVTAVDRLHNESKEFALTKTR